MMLLKQYQSTEANCKMTIAIGTNRLTLIRIQKSDFTYFSYLILREQYTYFG